MAMLRRISNLFRRSRVDREIDAELQAHIALRIDDNLAAGMSPAEARRDAMLRFGNLTATKERVTASDAHLSLEGLARDIRYALRQLRRSPGFALTAIITLALGIGANVVVFGVLNAILLQPINIPGAERLMEILPRDMGDLNHSYPDYVDLRARNTAFTDLAAYRISFAGLSTGGTAVKCWDYEVSSNYFDTLGVQPALGRFFHASDEHGPNSVPYLVISDAFWRNHFNADPRIVGTAVDLNKHRFTVIGVAPKSFNGTEIFIWPEFWVPMVNEEQIEGYSFLDKRSNHGIFVIGMMKPGLTPQQAGDNLNAVAHQLTRENPTADDGLGVRLTKPGLMGDVMGGPARSFLAGMMVISLLVLTAACVNLAGIFAARAADHARELAIRISIGSTRWRILRQLLTEAVLISVAGGIAGTGVATVMLGALSRWQPIGQYPIHVTAVPDVRVYALALVLSIVSGILPGLLPAGQVWRTDAMQAMKGGSARSGLLGRFTLRDVLLSVQVAICALLVTSSLVALRGMQRSLNAPFGFVPEGAMEAVADLHMAGYTNQTALALQRRMLEEAARIPGVTAVGTVNEPPLSGSESTTSVYREGTTDMRPSNSVTSAQYFSVSPGYVAAAGTRLLAGRDFAWDDGPKSPKVAIVNEFLARKMFGDSPALGRRFLEGDKISYEIVGVVEDGKYETMTEEPKAATFFPLAQSNDGNTTLIVRSHRPTAELAPELNRVLTRMDSSVPFSLRSWVEGMSLVLFPARVATAALGVMGLLAAMLAITGVFGMAAYSVSKRMRELGIRAALGARRVQLMRSALRRPVILLLAGSFTGVVLGVMASRLLAFLVYQATSRDPLVLAGTVLTMALIGVVATWIPARRALGVNPAQLLREE
jgi:predicted permease